MAKQLNMGTLGICSLAGILWTSSIWAADNPPVASVPTQSVITSPTPQPPAPESLTRPENPPTPRSLTRDSKGAPLLYVEFKTDHYDIPPAFYPQLNAFGDYLRRHPQSTAQLSGYADDSGHGPANASLSQKRANAVLAYLAGHYGISTTRIQTEGYGAKTDKPDNSTVSARQDDRRVYGKIIS